MLKKYASQNKHTSVRTKRVCLLWVGTVCYSSRKKISIQSWKMNMDSSYWCFMTMVNMIPPVTIKRIEKMVCVLSINSTVGSHIIGLPAGHGMYSKLCSCTTAIVETIGRFLVTTAKAAAVASSVGTAVTIVNRIVVISAPLIKKLYCLYLIHV